MKKIGVINLGSTSTKVAYFEDDVCVFSESISHPAEEVKQFASNWDQYDYRRSRIEEFFKNKGIDLKQLDALTPDGLKTRCQYRKGDAEYDAVVISFYPHKPAGNQRA